MTTYRIGEASRATGLSAHTIRFYEGRGLLPPSARSSTGYRQYDDADLRLLRLIHRARALDIPLDEVTALVAGIHDRTCGEYASRLSALVARQRAVVDERIAELERLRTELDTVAAEAESASGSDQRMTECTCCLLIDPPVDAHIQAAYCTPAPQSPAERFRAEAIEILQCEIDARPAAPTLDDLAPHLRSMDLETGRLVARFDPAAQAAVAAFAAAECLCCSGLGWEVSREPGTAVLSVTGTPQQLAALRRAFGSRPPARAATSELRA